MAVTARRAGVIALLGLLLLGGGLLRLRALTATPLWWDEGNNAYFARLGPAQLLAMSRLTHDTDPPAHRLALGLWLRAWGESAGALRGFSVACGLGTLLLTFAWGRRVGGNRTGLVAAALVALAPLVLYHDREAKGYPFVTMCATLAGYLSWGQGAGDRGQGAGRRRGGQIVRWAALILAQALALGAHYYAALFLVAQGVAWTVALLLLGRGQTGAWRRWAGGVIALLVSVALVAPWFALTYDTALAGARNVIPAERAGLAFLPYLRVVALSLAAGPFARGSAAWLALGALGGAAAWGLSGKGWRERLPLGALVVVPLLLGYFAQQRYPFFSARFLLYVWPPLAILAAKGIWKDEGGRMKDERLAPPAFTRDEGGRMKDERLAPPAFTRDEGGRMKDERFHPSSFILHPFPFLLLPLLLGSWAVILPSAYTPFIGAEEDLRPLAQPLRELARPGDGVIVGYIWQEGILRVIAPGAVESYTLGWFTPETVEGQMRELWAQHGRLWLLTYGVPAQDPTNPGLWWLESHAARAWSATHGPSRLTLYLRPCAATSSDATAPATATFGDGLDLALAPIAARSRPGDTLPLALRWRVTQPLAQRYTVFVHLYDAAGRLWAQSDSEPLNGLVAFTQLAPGAAVDDCRALLLPREAPPGAYFLTVGLYRSDSGERLPLRRGEGWGEQELRIGTVEITVP